MSMNVLSEMPVSLTVVPALDHQRFYLTLMLHKQHGKE